MGHKRDSDGLRSKIHSAGVQIKVLDQKGVIDIGSIQLWFALLFGSFGVLYLFWQFFVIEADPLSHFPPHMRLELDDQKHLYRNFGDRQGLSHTIHVAMVVCDVSKVDSVLATVKNLVLLSISPVNLLLFTQDDVMRKLVPEVERFSWSVPGRLQFRFEFGQREVFGYKEEYPCSQQKIMLPVSLQSHALPAIIVVSPEFLITSNSDDLWREEIIGMKESQAIGVFNDRDSISSDLFSLDLLRTLEKHINITCHGTDKQTGAWHNWKVWKGMRDQKPELPSIEAELKQLRHCNPHLMRRISYEFENGKFGLRRTFNSRVFHAIQSGFLHTDNELTDLVFNDKAWEALESQNPNNIDRNLLTDLLERIHDGFQSAINAQKERKERIEKDSKDSV